MVYEAKNKEITQFIRSSFHIENHGESEWISYYKHTIDFAQPKSNPKFKLKSNAKSKLQSNAHSKLQSNAKSKLKSNAHSKLKSYPCPKLKSNPCPNP